MRPVFSYLASVAAAALCLIVWSEWGVALSAGVVWLYVFEVVVAVLSVLLVTTAPFLVVRYVTVRRPRETTLACIPLGVCLGLVGAILLSLFAGVGVSVGDPERLDFWPGMARFWPMCLTAGLLGGLVYCGFVWPWVNRREGVASTV